TATERTAARRSAGARPRTSFVRPVPTPSWDEEGRYHGPPALLGHSRDQAQLTLILSKLTVTTCAAFVLRWNVSWASTCEPSVLVNVSVKVLCWTSFMLLPDSPNQVAK